MPDGVTIAAEIMAAVLLGVVLIPIVLLFARRRWLARTGWVFDCSLRRPREASTWMLGVLRLNGELIEWYRVFAWSLKPRVTLERGQVHVASSRVLFPDERALLFDQERVVVLEAGEQRVELAMAPERTMAFLSWLEAAPPGLGYR